MQALTPLPFSSFLLIGAYIYNNSHESGPFRPYCRKQIDDCLPKIATEPWLLDIIAGGGDLAAELYGVADRGNKGQLKDVNVVWPNEDGKGKGKVRRSMQEIVGATNIAWTDAPASGPHIPIQDLNYKPKKLQRRDSDCVVM